MSTPKPNALADLCPACGRHTLHKAQRHCVAYKCGYVETPVSEGKRPFRLKFRARKS